MLTDSEADLYREVRRKPGPLTPLVDGRLLHASPLQRGEPLFAGLVIDGGLVLAAQRRATNEAEAAARAGAQAVDIPTYRVSGAFVLDPRQAAANARGYLAESGHEGDVSVNGDRVVVTVRFRQPMQVLGIGGLGAVTVTGRGQARAERGVVSAEP